MKRGLAAAAETLIAAQRGFAAAAEPIIAAKRGLAVAPGPNAFRGPRKDFAGSTLDRCVLRGGTLAVPGVVQPMYHPQSVSEVSR